MAKQLGVAITWMSLLVAATGCGSSVTQPASVPKTSTETQAAPTVPAGPPTTPAPSPTPAPTPGPAPGPGTPPPPPIAATDYYDAEVGTVFWQGEPLFGNRFTIEVWPARGEVWLHNTRLWIAHRDTDSIIATDRAPGQGGTHTLTATLNLKTKQWSFNGVVGSGGGTLTFKESR